MRWTTSSPASLPDVGRAVGSFEFPEGSGPSFTPAERDLVTVLSLAFNAALDTGLESLSGIHVYRLDVFGLFEEVIADPEAFGFVPRAIDRESDDTDFGFPCLRDPECAANPDGPVADGFVLFDSIHPTAALHTRIAERAAILVPEPPPRVLHSSALLVILTLHWLAARASKRKNGDVVERSILGIGPRIHHPGS
jgi:phospholipase/lecithinase/hemolysin